MEFDTTVLGGLPCTVRVTWYVNEPDRLYGHPDNWSPGYSEVEFEILTRKGKPAAWIESRLTQRDNDAIVEEIHEQMREHARSVAEDIADAKWESRYD